MVTVDLITGFLGAGKTTFLKRYVKHLMTKNERVCVLENDFGAVNVDTMLLRELYDNGCGLEMVSGACDRDCHQRRFKTKLIAMAMAGYDHVVIEPSGIFDVDEFFDTLREQPLDRWYKIGSVIAIADPTMTGDISRGSSYLIASQAAVAGTILFSRCADVKSEQIERTLGFIKTNMALIRCTRDPRDYYIAKPWDELSEAELDEIGSSGCSEPCFVKMQNDDDGYSSVYFMNCDLTIKQVKEAAQRIFADECCGDVFRIKGFTTAHDQWYEVNVTKNGFVSRPIDEGQPIIIVIGENLDRDRISIYFN